MNEKKDSLWSAPFLTMLTVQFCLQMGQQMMNTLVPKYADALGATASVVGMVSSVFSIASTLILIFATPAFDCCSRKRLLQCGIAVLVVAFMGYGFSKSVAALFVFRIVQGFALGCTATLALVMVSDTLSHQNMGKGIGVFTLCQAVGQAVGPGLGLRLSKSIGYGNTFLIGTCAILLAFVLSFWIKDGAHSRGEYRIAWNRIIEKKAIHPAVLIFALQGPYCCIGSFIAIYGELLGVGNIGLYFTVYALCLLVTRPLSGAMIDRIGHEVVLIVGIICFGISFFLISVAQTLPMFLAAAAVSALGYGVCQPTLSYMCMSSSPKSHRGAASSTNSIFQSVGLFVGVSLAGWVVDSFAASFGDLPRAYSGMYRIMILPMAFALIYFLAVRKKITANMREAQTENNL